MRETPTKNKIQPVLAEKPSFIQIKGVTELIFLYNLLFRTRKEIEANAKRRRDRRKRSAKRDDPEGRA